MLEQTKWKLWGISPTIQCGVFRHNWKTKRLFLPNGIHNLLITKPTNFCFCYFTICWLILSLTDKKIMFRSDTCLVCCKKLFYRVRLNYLILLLTTVVWKQALYWLFWFIQTFRLLFECFSVVNFTFYIIVFEYFCFSTKWLPASQTTFDFVLCSSATYQLLIFLSTYCIFTSLYCACQIRLIFSSIVPCVLSGLCCHFWSVLSTTKT